MTSTARQQTRRGTGGTQDITATWTAITTTAGFDTCELCGLDASELYDRVTNADGDDVRICEHCADHADVRYGSDV